MALYVNSTPVRKLVKDGTTLHQLKINTTAVFDDKITASLKVTLGPDPQQPAFTTQTFELEITRADGLPIIGTIKRVDIPYADPQHNPVTTIITPEYSVSYDIAWDSRMVYDFPTYITFYVDSYPLFEIRMYSTVNIDYVKTSEEIVTIPNYSNNRPSSKIILYNDTTSFYEN